LMTNEDYCKFQILLKDKEYVEEIIKPETTSLVQWVTIDE